MTEKKPIDPIRAVIEKKQKESAKILEGIYQRSEAGKEKDKNDNKNE